MADHPEGDTARLQWHDETVLTVYTDRPRVFTRLWAIPGVRRWQVGDRKVRGLVPLEGLAEVAGLFQARRRSGNAPGSAQSE